MGRPGDGAPHCYAPKASAIRSTSPSSPVFCHGNAELCAAHDKHTGVGRDLLSPGVRGAKRQGEGVRLAGKRGEKQARDAAGGSGDERLARDRHGWAPPHRNVLQSFIDDAGPTGGAPTGERAAVNRGQAPVHAGERGRPARPRVLGALAREARVGDADNRCDDGGQHPA